MKVVYITQCQENFLEELPTQENQYNVDFDGYQPFMK